MGAGIEHYEDILALFHSWPQMAAVSRENGREPYEKRTERGDQEGTEEFACVCAGEKEREEVRNKNPKLGGRALQERMYACCCLQPSGALRS